MLRRSCQLRHCIRSPGASAATPCAAVAQHYCAPLSMLLSTLSSAAAAPGVDLPVSILKPADRAVQRSQCECICTGTSAWGAIKLTGVLSRRQSLLVCKAIAGLGEVSQPFHVAAVNSSGLTPVEARPFLCALLTVLV